MQVLYGGETNCELSAAETSLCEKSVVSVALASLMINCAGHNSVCALLTTLSVS
jgi:hypothetical protein